MTSGSVVAVIVCVAAGLGGAVQAALMGRFGERVGVLEAVAFASMVTTLVALGAVLVVRHSVTGIGEGFRVPPWLWLAGVMSALIVFAVALAPPKIGTTTTIGIIIAGNLVMAAVIDRYGLFGLERIGLSPVRVLGILLLGVGAALTLYRP